MGKEYRVAKSISNANSQILIARLYWFVAKLR